jgi:hypothetical protein
MKTNLPSLLLAAGLLAACSTPTSRPGASPGAITAEFRDPDRFTDARDSLGGATDQHALDTLRTHLAEKAAPLLQPGQKLHVVFTDIDLAGEFEPGARFDRVRLVKPIYFPRLELAFTLTDATGATLKEGTRTLKDMDFLLNAGRIGSDQPYYYDKLLLEEWLKKEFR